MTTAREQAERKAEQYRKYAIERLPPGSSERVRLEAIEKSAQYRKFYDERVQPAQPQPPIQQISETSIEEQLKRIGERVDQSTPGGMPIPGMATTEQFVRAYDPQRVEAAREYYLRAEQEYRSAAYRALGPNYEDILSKLSRPPPPWLAVGDRQLDPQQYKIWRQRFELYYGVPPEFLAEMLPQIQPAMSEAEAARQQLERTAGLLAAKPGETERQTYRRLDEQLSDYASNLQKELARNPFGYPERIEGLQRIEARREEARGLMAKAETLLESVRATLEQRWGEPLWSEKLAAAPGKLQPQPWEFGQRYGFSVTQITQSLALGGAAIVGIGESLEKDIRTLLGQHVPRQLKYRQPVTPFSLIDIPPIPGITEGQRAHEAAAWASPQVKLGAAVFGGIAGYGLEMAAFRKAITPPLRALHQAAKSPFETARLGYYQFKLGYSKELSPLSKVMGMLYEPGGPAYLQKIRKIPLFGKLFERRPSVEMAFAEQGRPGLAFGRLRESMTFTPKGIRMGELEYLRMREFLQTLKAPAIHYQIGTARAEIIIWDKFAKIFRRSTPTFWSRPAPETLATMAGKEKVSWSVLFQRQVRGTSRTLTDVLKQVTNLQPKMFKSDIKLVMRARLGAGEVFAKARPESILEKLRAALGGPKVLTKTRAMPSLDISWEFAGRGAPALRQPAGGIYHITRMSAQPTTATFELLAKYEKLDQEFARALLGGGKTKPLSEWAASFRKTFDIRASPARPMAPLQAIALGPKIKTIEWGGPFIAEFTTSVSSLAKDLAGVFSAAAVVPRRRQARRTEVGVFPHIKPFEFAAEEPLIEPIYSPFQSSVQAVRQQVRQEIKQLLETPQLQMTFPAVAAGIGVPAGGWSFPLFPEEKRQVPQRTSKRGFDIEWLARFWKLGRIEEIMDMEFDFDFDFDFDLDFGFGGPRKRKRR